MPESDNVKITENILLAAAVLALDVPYVRCRVRRTSVSILVLLEVVS
ncbi:MAG: hypothetical protein ABIK51_06000 [candidate division WOR-3 bacterium]